MSEEMIIRAWKDAKYRESLSPEERSLLPAHPAGEHLVELDEIQLEAVVGGASPNTYQRCYSNQDSCGIRCTFTAECPFLTLVCC